MSITTDARTYADSAVAQGRSALAHAGTALGQAGIALGAVNRRLLADAGKPVYAALGAADLVAASVTKRAEELPADAVQGLAKAQHTGQALIARAQSEAAGRLGELRGRIAAGRQTVTTLPDTARVAGEGYLTVAKSAGEAYLQAAKGVYASLTDRGEARAAELRKNPRLAKLLGEARETAGEVRDSVAPLAKSAFDAVTEPTVTEPTVAELKPARSTSTRRSAGTGSAVGRPAAKKSATRKTSKA
jgi:hypothetical protein